MEAEDYLDILTVTTGAVMPREVFISVCKDLVPLGEQIGLSDVEIYNAYASGIAVNETRDTPAIIMALKLERNLITLIDRYTEYKDYTKDEEILKRYLDWAKRIIENTGDYGRNSTNSKENKQKLIIEGANIALEMFNGKYDKYNETVDIFGKKFSKIKNIDLLDDYSFMFNKEFVIYTVKNGEIHRQVGV